MCQLYSNLQKFLNWKTKQPNCDNNRFLSPFRSNVRATAFQKKPLAYAQEPNIFIRKADISRAFGKGSLEVEFSHPWSLSERRDAHRHWEYSQQMNWWSPVHLPLGVGICPEVLPTLLSPHKYLPAATVLAALEKWKPEIVTSLKCISKLHFK